MSSLGPRYWKSLDELAGDENLAARMQNEFPDAADQTIDLPSRRNFFRLMGASMALAGIAGPGCQRYEKEEIVPLARRPEDQVPGTTLSYASVFELGGWGLPLVVTSYEGRPLHIDGNPQHPFTGDGMDKYEFGRHAGVTPFASASVLNVYDQDRSKSPLTHGKGATFDDFKNWIATAKNDIKANGGAVRVLSEATSSPTIAQLRRALTGAGVQWHEWEPLSFDNERAGLKLAFGKPLRAMVHLDRADTIVVLDGDIFIEHPAGMRYARDWKRSRGPEGSSLGAGKMNRMYSIESTFTSTGSIADHRLPLRSELILPFASALDAAISGGAMPSAEFLNEDKVKRFIAALAKDLNDVKKNGGHSVVIAGRRQSPQVHALAAKINDALGAGGVTVDYLDEEDRPTHVESISKLVSDMNGGQVKYLFILGGNPVYDAPADLDFGSALGKVDNSVHLSEWEDETSEKTTWHVPRANYLECWGDARSWDGTWTIQQPLIMPLYGGVSAIELLSMVAGDDKTGEQLVRANVESQGGGANWRKSVHDGFVANTAQQPSAVALQSLPMTNLSPTQLGGSRLKNGSLEVVYHYSSNTYDGRFANNAWLQETPDFFTKVVWDNYALVGPATAQDLGIGNESMIKLKVDGRELDVAAYVMPGQAMGSIGLVLGGGRTKAGSKGGTSADTTVGWNTYKVRSSKAIDFASGATVSAGDNYKFSGTQEHWDLRHGIDETLFHFNEGDRGTKERMPEIVKQVDHKAYVEGEGGEAWDAREEEEFWKDPRGRNYSLFQEKTYEGHRWGMTIDLGSCISCNACMVACQSENNIPVVGKDQVVRNREMHWIRIDRYFEGSPDDPRIVNQPVNCQQCENAPCEQVCPVGATMHSSEGLNDMVYNRCVGTRYCLNNCPYRVRRFNFLDWNKEFKDARNRVRKLVMNPEVTVRHRGVMEKCTYCVQRIQNKKIKAKNERRDLVDGEITTACQDACPTGAIVFGDLALKDSAVSALQADRRSYALLGNLNTKPRTQYLARVRNPNPDLG
ncbi:MAG TPA: TAT-variant-translocated molybdopterin oxidoreductase [Kofleriaceae bacterium]|nr:TAT-variant-translocated molybdopterin oxidoreductase [Kofleriaceae bacterium]